MIIADIDLDEAGLLISCSVSGHAGAGPRGGDVVCAAVSVLTRTAHRTLAKAAGVQVRGDAPARGVVRLETECRPEGAAFLGAVTALLVEGLESVAGDFPDHCSVRISTKRRMDHGS
jgi:uncharacterized protein YsxB (DUF464 family)